MAIFRTIMRVLLGLFFFYAGFGHFRNPEFFLNIMPDWMPAHLELVYLSGITEMIAGIWIIIPRTAYWGGVSIFAMLVAFFIIHIDMIVYAEKYESVPVAALWVRLGLQFVLLYWTWWCGIKPYFAKKTEAPAAG